MTRVGAGLSNRKHGELELMYVVSRPESKMWHACNLVDCDQVLLPQVAAVRLTMLPVQEKSLVQPQDFERVLSQVSYAAIILQSPPEFVSFSSLVATRPDAPPR